MPVLSVFQGRFRLGYLAVKVIGLYAGTFFLSYYWPLFINFVIDPPPLPSLQTLVLLPPLAFLVLGLCLGRRVFLVHLVLLMAAAPIAYWTSPPIDEGGVELLAERWIVVLLGAYLLGAVFGIREQLAKFKDEPELT